MSKNYTENWAVTLLGLSSILLLVICLFVTLRFYSHPSPQHIKVEWSIAQNDSVSMSKADFNDAFLDSIESVLALHEVRINEKYQHLIEEKEKEEDIKIIFVVFGGFIISIFAFFGYKSFKDIKKEAVEIAERVAAKAVDELVPKEIDSKFNDVYNNTMRSTIQKEINDRIPITLKDQVCEYLDSLAIGSHTTEPNQTPEEMFES